MTRERSKLASFLIDTNVISEVAKPHPNPQVVAFLHETDEDRLFISVVVLGELRRGVALKADGRAKASLDAWLRIDLPDYWLRVLLSQQDR